MKLLFLTSFFIFNLNHIFGEKISIKETKLDIITDLHAYPYEIPHEINLIKNMVSTSDFVVYNGDLLNSVVCPNNKKCNILNLVNDFVTQINKSYIFTLGNHDGEGEIRNEIINVLYKNPLHIGVCNNRKKACKHPYMNIYTLDSNTYGCNNLKSYGCPYKEDVEWINKQLNIYNNNFQILFTHIPPPYVIGLKGVGINDEQPTCWVSKDKDLLPYKQPIYHIFGHDHNNLYITEKFNNTTYINALKTGDRRSYGPDFGDSGITRILIVNNIPILNYSKSLNGKNVGRYTNKIFLNYNECGGTNSNITLQKTIFLSIISAALYFIFMYLCFKYQPNKKQYKYEKINN